MNVQVTTIAAATIKCPQQIVWGSGGDFIIHRHPSGSIDFDFYRTRAAALRGQAIRDTSALKAAGVSVLAMAGALAVVFLIAAAPMRAPNSHDAVVQTKSGPDPGIEECSRSPNQQ